jgi:hypothetical protein
MNDNKKGNWRLSSCLSFTRAGMTITQIGITSFPSNQAGTARRITGRILNRLWINFQVSNQPLQFDSLKDWA